MQQSTDHLSNVMAKLVMGSAVKATLRKCEEQWRREGTFHEEDIQQKLQTLEAVRDASIAHMHALGTPHTCASLCAAAVAQVPQPAARRSSSRRRASGARTARWKCRRGVEVCCCRVLLCGHIVIMFAPLRVVIDVAQKASQAA
jgi:hypothetical protein